MSRDLAPATVSASQAATIYPVLFVELAFDSGSVRFHSDLGDIAWGGNTFTGTGRLGGISIVEENIELARTPLTLSLAGLPTDLLAGLLSEYYQGRTATLYLGYKDTTTGQLVTDPDIVYRGRMDQPRVKQGEELLVSLSIESRFAAWDRANTRRYNNADQQGRFPGDRGLEFVEQAVEREIYWGVSK